MSIEYTPTPEHRQIVENTSGVGLPYGEIATLIGVDEETLLNHYGPEIELGQAKANGRIAKAIYSKAIEGDKASIKIWNENQTKRARGRPKGPYKSPMHKLAENTTQIIPKTDNQKIKELKRLLLDSAGSGVVVKAIEIAMNDEHPSQAAMIKLCMDRMLPVSMFEKEKNQRSAVTINITGLGETVPLPTIIDQSEDITDV
jgi:predicted transcriptional regulator